MQWETTSLISSPGGVKANEPAFGQRTTIISLYDVKCHYKQLYYIS